ncbi:MAG: helix-turn-helix domain-containing protein [Myxococcota bacterium]
MDARSIRALRDALGWSQACLAEHTGVSQPLVSAWESGRRTPQGPALRALQLLARDVDVSTETSPKRPREAILEAALRVLANDGVSNLSHARLAREIGYSRAGVEHHFPTRKDLLHALLDDYRARMKAETDRLYQEARRRREHRPRLWAYLEQARHAPGSDQSENLHRSAFLAFMMGDPSVVAAMRDWYEQQVAEVLDEARTAQERSTTQLRVLAVDAMWFFDLIGLQKFTKTEREAIVNTAGQRFT